MPDIINFKTFTDNNEEELQKQFDVAHNFQTNTRGLKIRGSYPTQEEAELRCKMLREYFFIFEFWRDIHSGLY